MFFAAANSKAKFGRCRKCVTVACQQLHPSRRSLQERHRAGEHGVKSRQNRKDNSQIPNPCRERTAATTPLWCPAEQPHRRSRSSRTLICSTLARMFLCEISTPAGVRVDPEVYCKYAMSGRLSASAAGPFWESRSSKSTSMTDGADSPGFELDVLGDGACDRGCRENGRRRRVTQDRTNTLIAGATQRNRQRNRDLTGL